MAFVSGMPVTGAWLMTAHEIHNALQNPLQHRVR
jgi:hypothetical protein